MTINFCLLPRHIRPSILSLSLPISLLFRSILSDSLSKSILSHSLSKSILFLALPTSILSLSLNLCQHLFSLSISVNINCLSMSVSPGMTWFPLSISPLLTWKACEVISICQPIKYLTNCPAHCLLQGCLACPHWPLVTWSSWQSHPGHQPQRGPAGISLRPLYTSPRLVHIPGKYTVLKDA